MGQASRCGLFWRAMRLSFHQRILLILICLGAIPTALAILGWGLTIRSTTQAPGARDAIEGVAAVIARPPSWVETPTGSSLLSFSK